VHGASSLHKASSWQARGPGPSSDIRTQVAPFYSQVRRTRSPCCARAASGHAAALPSSVMNSRRFIASLCIQDHAKLAFNAPHQNRKWRRAKWGAVRECALRQSCAAHFGSGSLASKTAEAVRPCTSAALPKADVNSPPWLPPLSANWRPEQMQQMKRRLPPIRSPRRQGRAVLAAQPVRGLSLS
jgi:hypothetical protein